MKAVLPDLTCVIVRTIFLDAIGRFVEGDIHVGRRTRTARVRNNDALVGTLGGRRDFKPSKRVRQVRRRGRETCLTPCTAKYARDDKE